LKLEINEIIDESDLKKISNFFPNFLPGALNFLSPRFASFTTPVERKEFTDSFLRFLDFPSKSIKMF
jgi:hypothetical protein